MNVLKMIAVGTLGALLISCGPPSRDSAVKKTAKKTCKRYDQCGTLDDNYSSYDECLTDWEDRFYDTWSEDECADDIDPEQLDECHVQIETFDCDNNGFQLLGLLLTSCSQAQVCD